MKAQLVTFLILLSVKTGLPVGHNNEIPAQAQERIHVPGANQGKGENVEITPHAPNTVAPHNLVQEASQLIQDISLSSALSGHGPNGNNGNAFGRVTPPSLIGIISGTSTPSDNLDSSTTPTVPATGNGDPTTQPNVPVLSGVLCYDDGPLIVQRNIPCIGKGLRKANLTGQTLTQLLRNEGGGFMGDLVSLEPPTHLRVFDLQTLEHSSWLNQNKTKIISNLQELLHDQKQHQNNLKVNIRLYLSDGNFTGIIAMAMSLIESFDKGYFIDIGLCVMNSSTEEGVNTESSDSSSCVVLLEQVTNLRSIHAHLLGVLTQSADNMASVVTGSSGSRAYAEDNNSQNSAPMDDELDRKIADLLQKVNTLQEQGRNILLLHNRLLNVTHSFQQTLVNFESDLYQEITQVNNTRDKLNSNPIEEIINSENSTKEQSRISNSSIIQLESKLAEYYTNISKVVEILRYLKANLTHFKDLVATVNMTLAETDPKIATWETWNSLSRRTKRSVTGFSVSSEICQRQGSLINQTNYISLCTTCAQTTVLTSEYFPRYLTEKVCGIGTSSNPSYQNGCLNLPGQVTGSPGGVCQQQQIHVILLRKIPGRCMKIRSQGQDIITDQWESTTHPLRIGCECVLNQNSALAKLAVFP